METLILKQFDSDTEGVIDYTAIGDSLKVRYCIKSGHSQSIVKLFLASSVKPSNEPIVADTLEFRSGSASGEKTISSYDAAYNGYRVGDIDTFLVVNTDAGNLTLLSSAFAGLYWDVESALARVQSAKTDKSLLNARRILQGRVRESCPDGYADVLNQLKKLTEVLPVCKVIPLPGLKWYTVESSDVPISAGAYEHILTPDAKKLIAESGHPLLFGMGDDGFTAIAAMNTTKNPFENASDCTVVKGGYFVVGVQFKEDGQYFVRPE